MVLAGVGLSKGLATFMPLIPYSVGLILWSVAVGVLHKETEYGLGLLSYSINQWTAIDAHTLLYVFLPPLLFGDTMCINLATATRALPQITMLACPGVLFGTGLTAVVSKCVLPYDWNWNFALCVGSIMAATDPVAVVALLK